MHSDSGDYTYTLTPAQDYARSPVLSQFDLRTADDHQAEQDRRLAVLEATIQEQNCRLAVLEHRLRLLEDAEAQP